MLFSIKPVLVSLGLAVALTCADSSSRKASSNSTQWSDFTFPGITSKPPHSPEVLHKRNYFYVGGQYTPESSGGKQEIMTGQIYVEQLIPAGGPCKKYPLVFLHGAGQTGTNWLNTPDGRMGWASYFLREGYEVFILDQPQRGRSIWELSQGKPLYVSPLETEEQFTAPQHFKYWPQAVFHTQWPGTGLRGDPVFDQFYASQVESQKNMARRCCHGIISSLTLTKTMASILTRNAGAALLNKIGPAILITHSEGGQLGWGIADAVPSKLAGLFALEPGGPPFKDAEGLKYLNSTARGWGLTDIPIGYDPPVATASDIKSVEVPPPAENLTSCYRQVQPAKRLANLAKIPMAMATSQASYHAPYDYCTFEYLKQGGVDVTYFNLTAIGILGNGHLSFLEKNNLAIAKVLADWFKTIEGS
ncbi:MAG: hypothetical protein M1828_006670 [Chrysothrix sp. TS-e1954]|nr:MAG: hypothetical protein M1828_006670 [Chrysothrix sp. TS-e1954]